MGRKSLPNPERGALTRGNADSNAVVEAKYVPATKVESVPVSGSPYELAAQEIAKTVLRMEMTRRKLTYRGLADLLVEKGLPENEPNARTKIARGRFGAGYFIACLKAMGALPDYWDVPDSEPRKIYSVRVTPSR